MLLFRSAECGIETAYLLKSSANVRHLMDSFVEYRSGKIAPQSIEELCQELGISD